MDPTHPRELVTEKGGQGVFVIDTLLDEGIRQGQRRRNQAGGLLTLAGGGTLVGFVIANRLEGYPIVYPFLYATAAILLFTLAGLFFAGARVSVVEVETIALDSLGITLRTNRGELRASWSDPSTSLEIRRPRIVEPSSRRVITVKPFPSACVDTVRAQQLLDIAERLGLVTIPSLEGKLSTLESLPRVRIRGSAFK